MDVGSADDQECIAKRMLARVQWKEMEHSSLLGFNAVVVFPQANRGVMKHNSHIESSLYCVLVSLDLVVPVLHIALNVTL